MSNSNLTSSFGASVALVLGEVRRYIKELRTKRLQFAIDVCLVAHGVRTGHLVDVVVPSHPIETFGTLLRALRSKSTLFNDVVFWHHTPTTQSFLVHVPLLQEKIVSLLGGAEECVFVILDKTPSVSKSPPDVLQDALHGVKSAMTESPDAPVLSLPEAFTKEALIPLAAVVIDYPVAYFPAIPTQTSFLEGEPLDVYTVSFKFLTEASDYTGSFGREHELLKFSCPRILSSSCAELSPSTLVRKLRLTFTATLDHIGASIFVTHRTETQDRVAL